MLETHRSLFGHILPCTRLISVDWSDSHYFIQAIVDNEESNPKVLELLKIVTSEIAAAFPSIINFKEDVICSKESIHDLKGIGLGVFMRFEPEWHES